MCVLLKRSFLFLFIFSLLTSAMAFGCLASDDNSGEVPSGKYGENISWTIADGVLSFSGEGKLSDYAAGYSRTWQNFNDEVHMVVFEEGITHIGNYALMEMDKVESVQLPTTLETIGNGAFEYCADLKYVAVPEGVTKIGNSAFEYSGLETIELPSSLQVIGDYALYFCNLTRVLIPENVSVIGDACFSKSIEGIYFMSDTASAIAPAAFASCEATVYIPENTTGWPEDFGGGCTVKRWSYSVENSGSCAEAGRQIIKSADGSVSFSRSAAPSHSLGEFELSSAPTAEKDGAWLRKCTICGEEEYIPIPKITVSSTPLTSNNNNQQSYGNYSEIINSYLTADEDGYTRVEYKSEKIYVEKYDKDFNFLSARIIEPELPLFGAYYSDGSYNYIVVGQHNPDENDYQEVIRLIRYSEDWYRMDSVSVYGANARSVFYASSTRMCSYGDFLYLRTDHGMYRSSDGRSHQSNMSFIVHGPTMTLSAESAYPFTDQWGYTSHCFNTFIYGGDGKLVAVDHGDAYPRSIVLYSSDTTEKTPFFPESVQEYEIMPIAGETGDNYTGVNLGAFEVSDSAYLVAGNSIEQGSGFAEGDDYYARNIFLAAVDKSLGEEADMHWFTSYSAGDKVAVSNPHLVKLGGNSFCLMWTENEEFCHMFINGNGEATSEIYRCDARLSDCKPILVDDSIVWYVTYRSTPVFYTIDLDAPDKVNSTHNYTVKMEKPDCVKEGRAEYTCTDCGYSYSEVLQPLGHDTIVEAAKAADCTNEGFTGSSHCARCGEVFIKGEAIPALGHSGEWTILKKASYTESGLKERLCTRCGEREAVEIPVLILFDDVPGDSWFAEAVAWAVENGVTSGVTPNSFAPDVYCTRAQAVTFLWRAAGEPAPKSSVNPFKDVAEGQYYYDAVLWAVENGITAGLSADSFGPDASCTRGQIVTFLWRATGKPAPTRGENPFADVPGGAYYYDAVLWAVEKNVTSGMSATGFAPDATCTRGQIVTFLYRAEKS